MTTTKDLAAQARAWKERIQERFFALSTSTEKELGNLLEQCAAALESHERGVKGEATISTEHGPWVTSTYAGEEGERYCKRCLLRDKFLGQRKCEPHIVHATPPTAPAQDAQGSAAWENSEGWESLAWELCADEHGEDACSELIWEGGPVPEPWGDRWMKYEDEAKRLIALVHKHVPATPSPQAERVPLSDADRYALVEQHLGLVKHRDDCVIDRRTGRYTDAARYFDLIDAAIERAHGIVTKGST